MNQPLANTLTNAPDEFMFISLCIIAFVFFVLVLAVLWLSRLVFQLKREYMSLTTIVNNNKNDIYGLCSAALTVNENAASVNEQLHNMKQQLVHIVEKMHEFEQGDFMNSAYNVDIRKIRDGANVEELMKQSELSYDEAALLIRLHGKA